MHVHPVLQNGDILPEIFQHLSPERCGSGHSTLARAALVCKAFSDYALNVLWEEYPPLMALVKMLPQSTSNVHSGEDAQAAVTKCSQNEWFHFDVYAERIRKLSVSAKEEIPILRILPFLFSRARDVPLFPSLVSLEFDQFLRRPHEYFILFLSPSLRYFSHSIHDHSLRTVAGEARLDSVLDVLQAKAPFLQNLACYGVTNPTSLPSLTRLKGLQYLDLPRMTVFQVLSYCAELPQLKRLHTALREDLGGTGRIFPSRDFVALQSLSVSGAVSDMTGLLTAISSPNLHSFTVLQFMPQLGFGHVCRGFIQTLVSRFGQSLRHVHLQCDFVFCADPGNHPIFRFVDVARPLLSLRHLELLVLCFYQACATVTYHEFEEMASSWPMLEELTLRFGMMPPPVSGLAAFARHCPKLTRLAMFPMDLAVMPKREPYSVSHHNLRGLTIENLEYTAPEPHQLAHFIDCTFPQLDASQVQINQQGSDWLVFVEERDARRASTQGAL
ncbi:hypothetical protein SCP_1001030 [Sparassis crispa]|uniref:F-box domain-containing protein n=1 Tax=Sparassis crispa TaxID=139825 RepID=A0A401GXB5_9APHY|nr:hypothetical protein SCP_1001030 [Sparassis crispa]GBE86861.1 hypothetical protein SCP_1001030 [Sparassis crispa]